MTIAIVLAAGAGTRIGYPKALLEASGHESFVSRACRVLAEAGADDIVVVTTAALAPVVRQLTGGEIGVAVNDRPERGQLSSLQCAIASFPALPDAMIVLPVDVPLVGVETVRQLLARWRETRAPVVRPVSGGRHGHPVIFDGALLPELARAGGPDGANPIVRAHASAAGEVDVDTPGEYEAMMRRF